MDDRDRQHLGNLISHAQAAIGYARAHGRHWWKNPETFDAVLMRISQVGEAASRTSPGALADVPGVTWRDVKGIRARVVHDYQAIDVLVVRGVVSRQLPRLITSVRKALAEEEKRIRQSDTGPPTTPPPTGGPRRSGSSP
jgi:uncharacterized protein with HEPN domain